VAVAIAGTSVLGPQALGASRQPIADVMATAVGHTSADIVAIVAIVATTNTTLLALTAASRLQYGMATTGALPAALLAVNPRRAPWKALVVGAVVAAGFVAIGDLTLVASVTDFAVYVVFVGVNLAVIALRFRQPNRRRPFRVPLTVGRVPLPTVAALVTVSVLIPSLVVEAIAVGLALCVAGIVVYVLLLLRRRRRQPATITAGEEDMAPRTTISRDESRSVARNLHIDFDAVEFDLEQFRAGMQVELQHGRADPDTNVTDDDLLTTGKIVLAHLNEIPDYYSRLAAMEQQARREWRRR
jgi:amino acid transporter